MFIWVLYPIGDNVNDLKKRFERRADLIDSENSNYIYAYKKGAMSTFPIIEELVGALEFYSKGEHYEGDWDSVSGEPPNMLCLAETDEWHWIESGAVAEHTLTKLNDWLEGKE